MAGSLIAALSEQSLRGQLFTPRWGLSAAHLQAKVYVFGGYLWCHGLEGFFQDLYELDLSTSSVRRVVPESAAAASSTLPAPRFGHTLVADPTKNQLLLFGGRNTQESFNDLWSFNVAKSQWTQLSSSSHGEDSPSPSRRKNGRKAVDREGSKGFASPSDAPSPGTLTSVASVSAGPEPRSWHTATIYRNAVYIYGGWDHHNRVFNDLWCFDLGTLSWSRIEPPDAMSRPPHGRSCHQAALWGEHLYIFGGLRDGDAVTSDIWRFSFEARAWTPVESLGTKPAGRTSAAGVVVGDSWVIHGGLNDYPRTGMSAISEVLEFNFPTSTWIPRAVLLSDAVAPAARRYGHVAVALPNTTAVFLLGGAEKYAAACPVAACRVDLLPSQNQVTELQQDLFSTTRVSQLNRERLTEIVEIVQTFENQIRQLRTENGALAERCQNMQTQMAALHQQQAALQSSFQAVQQALAAVEQFIPMMRSVGAAIANFGNAAAAQSSWSAPGSSASLNTSRTQSGLQSAGDLRYGPKSNEA